MLRKQHPCVSVLSNHNWPERAPGAGVHSRCAPQGQREASARRLGPGGDRMLRGHLQASAAGRGVRRLAAGVLP